MKGYVAISERQYQELVKAEQEKGWKFALPADGYVEPSDACTKQHGQWFMEQSAYDWWKKQGVVTELNATACIPAALFLGWLALFH